MVLRDRGTIVAWLRAHPCSAAAGVPVCPCARAGRFTKPLRPARFVILTGVGTEAGRQPGRGTGGLMSAQDRIRSIRLSLRFIAPLVVTLALLAYALVPLVDRLTLRWWVSDLDIRSQVIANTMEEQLADLVEQGASSKINVLFTRALQDERLYALAFCDESGKLRYQTATYPASLGCNPPVGAERRALGGAPAPGAAARRAAAGVPGQRSHRLADPGARHELRRAAQRRHAPLPDRPVRGAGRGHFPGDRVHRAPVLARLGRRRARAAARRGHRAAVRAAAPRTICIRWRAICARCCATSTCRGAAPTGTRPGARKCCAGCCAKSCWATKSWSFPTASRSCTCIPTRASGCNGRRAAWSRRSSR